MIAKAIKCDIDSIQTERHRLAMSIVFRWYCRQITQHADGKVVCEE